MTASRADNIIPPPLHGLLRSVYIIATELDWNELVSKNGGESRDKTQRTHEIEYDSCAAYVRAWNMIYTVSPN